MLDSNLSPKEYKHPSIKSTETGYTIKYEAQLFSGPQVTTPIILNKDTRPITYEKRLFTFRATPSDVGTYKVAIKAYLKECLKKNLTSSITLKIPSVPIGPTFIKPPNSIILMKRETFPAGWKYTLPSLTNPSDNTTIRVVIPPKRALNYFSDAKSRNRLKS